MAEKVRASDAKDPGFWGLMLVSEAEFVASDRRDVGEDDKLRRIDWGRLETALCSRAPSHPRRRTASILVG